MQELKQSAMEHIEEWIRQLGATWLEGTKDKLAQLEILLTTRKNIVEDHLKDGSIEIDIEMLLIEVKKSWYRLGHYGIQVKHPRLYVFAISLFHFFLFRFQMN